jgi:hypothetical protein
MTLAGRLSMFCPECWQSEFDDVGVAGGQRPTAAGIQVLHISGSAPVSVRHHLMSDGSLAAQRRGFRVRLKPGLA